jgi:hypothetical protein
MKLSFLDLAGISHYQVLELVGEFDDNNFSLLVLLFLFLYFFMSVFVFAVIFMVVILKKYN